MSNVTVAISELARAGTRDASERHRFRFVRIFPFNPGEAGTAWKSEQGGSLFRRPG